MDIHAVVQRTIFRSNDIYARKIFIFGRIVLIKNNYLCIQPKILNTMLTPVKPVRITDCISVGSGNPLCIIAGPCVIESEEMSLRTAILLRDICARAGVNFIFKSSFDKANRSSIHSFRGPGIEEGLKILHRVRTECGVAVITDVHEAWQCSAASAVVDALQIPAFLARQTDLLAAAAHTCLPVNIKKGQFMAPWDMKNTAAKLTECGAAGILLCERGSSFGYNNLVVDMAGLAYLRTLGYPVVFDATHSVQKPSAAGATTGGAREMIVPLTRAALAVGVDAIFAEVHPDPDNAHSDAACQLPLARAEEFINMAKNIHNFIAQMPLCM
jgi:2-dehydro-3-deoxyphosphooctonate aldolase (KDO 8-P synthase)